MKKSSLRRNLLVQAIVAALAFLPDLGAAEDRCYLVDVLPSRDGVLLARVLLRKPDEVMSIPSKMQVDFLDAKDFSAKGSYAVALTNFDGNAYQTYQTGPRLRWRSDGAFVATTEDRSLVMTPGKADVQEIPRSKCVGTATSSGDTNATGKRVEATGDGVQLVDAAAPETCQ